MNVFLLVRLVVTIFDGGDENRPMLRSAAVELETEAAYVDWLVDEDLVDFRRALRVSSEG